MLYFFPGLILKMNKSQNILIYANNQHCYELITLLKNEDWLKYFKTIRIDDPEHPENVNLIPPSIKYTPTLIVSNMPKPLSANEAFNWVYTQKMITQQNMEKQQKMLQLQQSQMSKCMKAMVIPLAFVNKEMNGFSDTFAFASEQINDALPQTYIDPKTSANELKIVTPPKENKYDRLTKKNQETDVKKLQRMREDEDLEVKRIFDEKKKKNGRQR